MHILKIKLLIHSVFLGLFLLYFSSVKANPSHPDSLFKQARSLLEQGRFDEVIDMGDDFQSLFQRSGDSTYLFNFFKAKAFALYYSGRLQEAEKHWLELLTFPGKILKPAQRADFKFNLCECYRKMNDLYRSHKSCLEALSAFRKLGIIDGKIQVQLLLTEHWIMMDQLDSATYYAELSLKEARSNKQMQNIAQSHLMFSKIFSKKESWDQAKKEMEKAVELFESIEYWPNVMFGYNEIAKFNLEEKKYHGAAQAASNVLEFIDKVYLPEQHIQALVEMAFSYSSLNLLKEANYWLDSAQKVLPAITAPDYYLLERFYEVKKELAIKNGDKVSEALADQKIRELSESLKKLKPDSVITLGKLNYELESFKEKYNTQFVMNNYLRYGLIGSGFFILILVSLLIQKNKVTRSIIEKVKFQTKELEELRSEQIIDYHINLKSLNRKLRFDEINQILNNQLNETDIKILELIAINPNISNKELSDSVNISYDGLRSSLKKMYKLFGVNESVSNKKLGLLTNAFNLTSENSSDLKL